MGNLTVTDRLRSPAWATRLKVTAEAADRLDEMEVEKKKLMLALDHWASTARMLSQRVEELVKNDE